MKINPTLRTVLGLAALMALVTFSLAVFPASAGGPWYVATTGVDTNDCLSAGSPCASINGAIGKASAGDTIFVAIGTYTDTGDEVVLLNKDATLSGGWDESFTIQSGMSTIDGEQSRRGITANSSVIAVVGNFAVVNGSVEGGFAPLGGGVLNKGSLTLNDSIISDNSARDGGGGISNNDAGVEGQIFLTLNRSSVTGNTARAFSASGGGIRNGYNSTLILNNSTVSGNMVGENGAGGGIFVADSDNSIAILNNSTVSGNTSGNDGGGIFSRGMLILNNSTISANSVNKPSDNGGGISVENSVTGDTMLQNTIIAGNTVTRDPFGHPDCNAEPGAGGPTTIISLGYNLVGNSSGCTLTVAVGDFSDIDPLLGPLQDNGGPTFTHALLPGSPAIDAGNPAAPGSGGNACLATDQRGIARPQGAACDMGAFELEMIQVVQVTIDIKPGGDPNSVNPRSKGAIPVAILTTDDFDATTVDPLSVQFGPNGATEAHGNGHIKDSDGDGDLDLVLHFKTQDTGIQCGDTEASLAGETFGGEMIEGTDSISLVGCK